VGWSKFGRYRWGTARACTQSVAFGRTFGTQTNRRLYSPYFPASTLVYWARDSTDNDMSHPRTCYTPIVDSDRDSDSDSDNSTVHGTDYDGGRTRELSSDRARRRSFIEDDEESLQLDITSPEKKDTVTWMSLPHKRQLAILTIARLSEPLVQSSLRVRANSEFKFEESHLTYTSLISFTSSNPSTGLFLTRSFRPRLELFKELLRLPNYAQPCYGAACQIGEDAKECFL
jgi:hypothetical protein